MTEARAAAVAFLTALERRDVAAIDRLLADDVVQLLPLAASGELAPAAVFDGRAEVLRVQRAIIDSFDPIAFADSTITVGTNGTTVFVETVGERLHQDSGRTYRNVYVYKFELRDGLINRICEYSNPVAFATFFDQPLG